MSTLIADSIRIPDKPREPDLGRLAAASVRGETQERRRAGANREMSTQREIAFGGHYGADGNTWIDADGRKRPRESGATFERKSDGIEVSVGGRHLGDRFTLSEADVQALRTWLNQ